MEGLAFSIWLILFYSNNTYNDWQLVRPDSGLFQTAESYEEEYISSASDVSRRHNTTIYSRLGSTSVRNLPSIFDSRYHGYAYDGIWTIARAIQAVEIESRQINKSLTDFEYKWVILPPNNYPKDLCLLLDILKTSIIMLKKLMIEKITKKSHTFFSSSKAIYLD